MARLRKFVAYRKLERPYTRISKYRKLSYVRTRPASKIVKYNMGNLTDKFDYTIKLVAKDNLNIRHNALESARLTATRTLEKALGRKGFCLRIRAFPHHILRENPLASGAGADRMSTGMKMSFGKTIGTAARVFKGAIILEAFVNTENLAVGKRAVKKSSYKLPLGYSVVVEKSE